jgi:hypothetical protein
MNENPDVNAWLAELEHPLRDVLIAVRSIFLEADERITETIKWKSPTFMYEGNLASLDPKARKHVAVLFHRGAEIPGDHPLLEGEGKLARYTRFQDMASVEAGRAELVAVVRAWCDDKENA